ncbi:protein phosphatase 1 regulatory subunit 42 [Chryseobacterium sp. S0630]|uniref:protein phosphatase 1 regulatory subunit 42 n=1 Tax=Chryseobacterium sp. S0630 TaxID=2957803 RepID=UPI00209F1B56|nr:protein phosphatase 1 regulatory subunit 42 [Chryseobacterium sp. S0630]MCP1301489.1 protein phosphatase 1 regulatory subunit 42 [Chryseobacterium sp. S0630]
MLKIISTFAVILSINIIAQEISIKDNNLKTALLQQFDQNHNGKLEISEIKTVTELKLDEKNISELSGLEHFQSLKELNLRKNNISDFSLVNKLTKLENLYIGDNNKIGVLDLKGLVNLKGIYAFRLGLTKIQLNSKNIQYIYLQDNLFTDFDTRKFPALHTLNLDGCKPLVNLDLSKNNELVQLYLLGTSIKELDITNNKTLKTFYIENSVKLIKGADQEATKLAPIITVK